MDPSRIATYSFYKSVYTKKDITKADILEICKSLTVEFQLNKLGNHMFEPEPITEGGIIFSSYKNIGSPYKTMRFLTNRDWQYISDPWESSLTDVVIRKNKKIELFLKAFDGAPKWTSEEKNAFKRVLCNNGFTLNKRGLKIIE